MIPLVSIDEYNEIVSGLGDRDALVALYEVTDGWHPDDPAGDIFCVPEGQPLFDLRAAKKADALIARLYRDGVDPSEILATWLEFRCRCGHKKIRHHGVCEVPDCDCDVFEYEYEEAR